MREFCYNGPMRALIQRVSRAAVTVGREKLGAIGPGLLIFICAMAGDGDEEARFLAGKIAKLRIFADGEGKTNLSIGQVGGEALVVSQFTLAANWRKGNRAGFSKAAPPEEGERLYGLFADLLEAEDVPVARGRFGVLMEVSLVNDGPFTIWMDTEEK